MAQETISKPGVVRMYTSYSAMQKHRECPQRWNYAHLRKLQRAEGIGDVPVELDMGLWWHMLRAADSIDRGRQKGSLAWVPRELKSVDTAPALHTGDGAGLLAPIVHGLAEQWWAKQNPMTREAWSERLGSDLPERLRTLDSTWKDEHWGDIEQEEPLAVELKWERDLPMPKGSRPATIVGYVDEIFLDKRRNLIVARDWKLHKKFQAISPADDMMDSQLQFYAWGASPTVTAWGRGQIQATAYDRTRMVKPKSPVLTASGSLSKSVTDYDLSTYVTWALGPEGLGIPWGEPDTYVKTGKNAGKPKFGMYVAEDAVVQRLSSRAERLSWFMRTLVPLNKNIIRTHLRAGVDTAIAIQATFIRATQTGEAPRNMSTSACRFCDFSALCRAEMVGGPDGTYSLVDAGLMEKRAVKR